MILLRLLQSVFAPHRLAPLGAAARTTMPTPLAEDPADTLDGLFRKRVAASPGAVAYQAFDPATEAWRGITWGEAAAEVARWRTALATLNLAPGERVAIMLANRAEWVWFDQAALALGLVTVPIFVNDRPGNAKWILNDSECRVLLIDGPEQWAALAPVRDALARLAAVITLRAVADATPNLRVADEWLPAPGEAAEIATVPHRADDLATLVYTSGTTGRPKGVMLSHRNLLFNVHAGLKAVPLHGDDLLLSFLPLSHTLERTVGYYLSMLVGCRVAFARSIPQLAEDLIAVRPTVLISVPRIFERVHQRVRDTLAATAPVQQRLCAWAINLGWQHFLHRQGRLPWRPGLLVRPALDCVVGARIRARLGGRLRFAISGGAPLSAELSHFFIALGVEILQGYGLTEASPVISVNRHQDNEPTSVGPPLPGIEVRIGDNDELLTRSPSVMLGIWHDPAFTHVILDGDGWLHTGDCARIGPRGHITITGRIKDILVLSTGEKISPVDAEQALKGCPLVEQVMVVGDNRPYLGALVVPRREALFEAARAQGLPAEGSAFRPLLLEQLRTYLHDFPGYAKLARIALVDEPWTVENGLLTPTLKLKRGAVLERYRTTVGEMYARH